MSNYTIQVSDALGNEMYTLEMDPKRTAIRHAKLIAKDLRKLAAIFVGNFLGFDSIDKD